MKRIVLGSMMMLGGIIGSALLMIGAMNFNLPVNGQHSFLWSLSKYGLDSAFYIFIIIATIGFIVAVSALVNKNN